MVNHSCYSRYELNFYLHDRLGDSYSTYIQCFTISFKIKSELASSAYESKSALIII